MRRYQKVEISSKARQGDAYLLTLSVLVAVGLIGAWIAWVVAAQSLGTAAGEGVVGPGEKPFHYYIAHGTGLLAVILAGLLACLKGEYRRLDRLTRTAFWVLQLTAVTWALISYSSSDYLSLRAFGATGPFVWISTLLIFAGMEKRVWPTVDRVILLLSTLTALLAIVAVGITHRDLSDRWFSTPVFYMVLLMWFGGWTLLGSIREHGFRQYLGFFPYIIFLLLTVITRTRSWLLMSLLLLAAFLALNKPAADKHAFVSATRIKSIAILLFTLCIAGYLVKEPLLTSIADLGDRALQDTRSGQYVEFFSDVPVGDLLFGRGPNGTWNWNGKDYQFFDNAVLWMAFIGGIPTAISYLILIVLPGIKALGSGSTEINSSAVLLLLWGVACTGFSTYTSPSLTPYSYLICLLAGRCLGSFADQRSNKMARSS